MSAIEILKDMINWRKKGIREFIFLHNTGGEMILEIERNVLGEALLALEQKLDWDSLQEELEQLRKEKKQLKEWLEKRIEGNQKRLDWQMKNMDIPYSTNITDGIQQRIVDYKEVLGELK